VRGPDAAIAVRLQLHAHRPALGPLGVVADPAEDAEQVLDVVAVLMGEPVRLRERRPARAEPRLDLVEEAEVDVDELVPRAVEGPDLRSGEAAAGLDLVGEKDAV